jgi:phosphomannomutase/phosphoglucomutase
MSLNAEIFRAYDIRGVADRDLTDDVAFDLGRALGTEAVATGATTFAVGRDCRLSGPRIQAALVRGLSSTGLRVLDVGMVPTPVLYFAVFFHNLGGGVQITGSHNPPEFNGFKMLLGRDAMHGDGVQGLYRRMVSQEFVTGAGSLERLEIEESYLNHVASGITMGPRALKVLIDGGNGIGGPLALQLAARLGVEAVGRFIEPDGRFPNHHPDPTTVETVEIMAHDVKAYGCDFAVGLDGDADRVGVVDGNGEVQWGDRLLALFARGVLKEAPGATIVGEVKCSKTLYDDIAKHGGVPVMWKTGHSLIKAKMKETGALLAGEMSGHIFFKHRYYGYDDGLYAMARLLELMSHSDETISQMLSDIPTTFVTPELRVDCPDHLKFAIVERVVASLKAQGLDVNDIDGARVTYADGWGLIRASNTQPVLVMRTEATTPERRDAIRAFLDATIAAATVG